MCATAADGAAPLDSGVKHLRHGEIVSGGHVALKLRDVLVRDCQMNLYLDATVVSIEVVRQPAAGR
jgi:hypothetical protein